MAHSAAIAKRIRQVESDIAQSREMIAQYREVIAHLESNPGDPFLPFHHLSDGEKSRIHLGANARSVVIGALINEERRIITWTAWLQAVADHEAKWQAARAVSASSIGGAR
jgi:hypothetical protein